MTATTYAQKARATKRAEADASGIDDALISALVDDFYNSVRRDALLGPIFAGHVTDWAQHLPRMKDFWASIMIESGRFNGSPMQKHIALGILNTDHFAHWLALWDQSVERVVPDTRVADRFRMAARRIAKSLLSGIQIARGGLSALQTFPALPSPSENTA